MLLFCSFTEFNESVDLTEFYFVNVVVGVVQDRNGA